MGTGDGSKNETGRLNHGGYWLETNTWPLENALETTYYFHADGSLNGTQSAVEITGFLRYTGHYFFVNHSYKQAGPETVLQQMSDTS